MAGTSLAAHARRLAVVLGIAALIALAFIAHSWPSSRQAAAAGDSDMLVDSGAFGSYSSIVLDSSGKPVVSYYDSANNDVKVLHCGNTDCSAGNSIVIADGTATLFASAASLALDPGGNPVLAYYDISTNLLNILHCGDPTCSVGNTIATPEVANAGSSASLAVDVLGHPVVSYVGADNRLKVLHCGNAACTTGNTIATPDPYSIHARTKLTLDTFGSPIISFQDRTYDTLKILHCGTSTCLAGNTIAEVDRLSFLNGYSSLAVDSAGIPTVSFSDASSGKLKILRCGNPNCSSGNSISSPDGWGYSGYSSLALDSAGLPIISWGSGPFAPAILRCGNPNCTSGNVYSKLSSYGPNPSLTLDVSGFPVISLVAGGLRVIHCGTANCKSLFNTPTPSNTPTGTPLPTAAPPGRPNFSIGIDTNGDAVDDCRTNGQAPTKCTMTLNSTFQLRVYLDAYSGFPDYDGLDIYITYFGMSSNDDPSTVPWPDCGFAGVLYKPSLIKWGCALGNGAPPSTYTGLIGTNHFNCTGSGGIVMTHGFGHTGLNETGAPRFESDGTESLTINCLPSLGGVADYPNVSGGSSAWPIALLVTAFGALAMSGAAFYVGRRPDS